MSCVKILDDDYIQGAKKVGQPLTFRITAISTSGKVSMFIHRKGDILTLRVEDNMLPMPTSNMYTIRPPTKGNPESSSQTI